MKKLMKTGTLREGCYTRGMGLILGTPLSSQRQTQWSHRDLGPGLLRHLLRLSTSRPVGTVQPVQESGVSSRETPSSGTEEIGIFEITQGKSGPLPPRTPSWIWTRSDFSYIPVPISTTDGGRSSPFPRTPHNF